MHYSTNFGNSSGSTKTTRVGDDRLDRSERSHLFLGRGHPSTLPKADTPVEPVEIPDHFGLAAVPHAQDDQRADRGRLSQRPGDYGTRAMEPAAVIFDPATRFARIKCWADAAATR